MNKPTRAIREFFSGWNRADAINAALLSIVVIVIAFLWYMAKVEMAYIETKSSNEVAAVRYKLEQTETMLKSTTETLDATQRQLYRAEACIEILRKTGLRLFEVQCPE